MGLTKVEMWITIIGLVLVFAFSINILGGDLLNSDVELDTRSQDYISEFSSNIEENDFADFTNNETLDDKKSNPILTTVTNLPIISDVLGGINFFIEKTKVLMDAIAITYNLPSFFLKGFGLKDIGEFNHVVNIIGAVLFLAFTVMLVRLVK